VGPDVRSGHAYLDGTVGNGLLDAAVLSLRHTRVTQYPLDAHERESDGMHLAGSTQERLLAGVWQNRAGTVAHPRVLRGDEAQLAARAEHNVDAEFLAFMSQFNEAPDGVQALRQRLPEPACAKSGALLQAQAAAAVLVLPGLARRMQQSRWRTPAQMKALLSGLHLAQEIHQHSRAAVMLDYFARPFVCAHAWEPSQGGASMIKVETLRHLVRGGQAVQNDPASTHQVRCRGARGANANERATERTVRDKSPEPQAGAHAIPTHEQLPPQDWRSGKVDWGQGNTEERTERSVCFGGKSVQLRLDSLKGVLAGLSKQKADMITNVFLRRVFKDGNAPTVDAVLAPVCIHVSGGHRAPRRDGDPPRGPVGPHPQGRRCACRRGLVEWRSRWTFARWASAARSCA
jgi:hypothetical protein